MKHLIDLPKPAKLITFDVIGSTNDKARQMAGEGAAEWTIIWSKSQNQGKGRQKKIWISPVGNLYISLILRPESDAETISQYSFVIPLAIADTIKAFLPKEAEIKLKWPNDIIVNDKKLAGILLESSFAGSNVEWLVAGIGINIKSFPAAVDFPATSLNAEKAEVELEVLLEKLIVNLKNRIRDLDKKGFAGIRTEWLKRVYGLNKKITIKIAKEIVAGTFNDIDDKGFLEVKLENGKIKKISAGDVFFENYTEVESVK